MSDRKRKKRDDKKRANQRKRETKEREQATRDSQDTPARTPAPPGWSAKQRKDFEWASAVGLNLPYWRQRLPLADRAKLPSFSKEAFAFLTAAKAEVDDPATPYTLLGDGYTPNGMPSNLFLGVLSNALHNIIAAYPDECREYEPPAEHDATETALLSDLCAFFRKGKTRWSVKQCDAFEKAAGIGLHSYGLRDAPEYDTDEGRARIHAFSTQAYTILKKVETAVDDADTPSNAEHGPNGMSFVLFRGILDNAIGNLEDVFPEECLSNDIVAGYGEEDEADEPDETYADDVDSSHDAILDHFDVMEGELQSCKDLINDDAFATLAQNLLRSVGREDKKEHKIATTAGETVEGRQPSTTANVSSATINRSAPARRTCPAPATLYPAVPDGFALAATLDFDLPGENRAFVVRRESGTEDDFFVMTTTGPVPALGKWIKDGGDMASHEVCTQSTAFLGSVLCLTEELAARPGTVIPMWHDLIRVLQGKLNKTADQSEVLRDVRAYVEALTV